MRVAFRASNGQYLGAEGAGAARWWPIETKSVPGRCSIGWISHDGYFGLEEADCSRTNACSS
jgi:hypothetical protein